MTMLGKIFSGKSGSVGLLGLDNPNSNGSSGPFDPFAAIRHLIAWELSSTTYKVVGESDGIPVYGHRGWYQDAAGTIPANIDDTIGCWNSNTFPVTEDNLMLRPAGRLVQTGDVGNERFIPAVEFNNKSLVSVNPAAPHAAVTVVASISGSPGYSQLLVIGNTAVDAIRLGVSENKLAAGISGGFSVTDGATFWPQQLAVVSVAIVGGNMSLYLNGELLAFAPIALSGFSGAVFLGGDWGNLIGGNDPWAGFGSAFIGYDASVRTTVEAEYLKLIGKTP